MLESPPDSAIADKSIIVEDSSIANDSGEVHEAKHENASQV